MIIAARCRSHIKAAELLEASLLISVEVVASLAAGAGRTKLGFDGV
jgi:hypothetical protein